MITHELSLIERGLGLLLEDTERRAGSASVKCLGNIIESGDPVERNVAPPPVSGMESWGVTAGRVGDLVIASSIPVLRT